MWGALPSTFWRASPARPQKRTPKDPARLPPGTQNYWKLKFHLRAELDCGVFGAARLGLVDLGWFQAAEAGALGFRADSTLIRRWGGGLNFYLRAKLECRVFGSVWLWICWIWGPWGGCDRYVNRFDITSMLICFAAGRFDTTSTLFWHSCRSFQVPVVYV